MAQRRGVLLGATFMSFGNVVRIALQLVSLPILARILGPGVYGLVSFSMAIIAFSSVICETGLSGAIGRGVELSPRKISTIFWVTLLSGLTFTLLVDAGVGVFWLVQPKATGGEVVLALSPILLSSALLALPSGMIYRTQKFWAFALSDIASVISSNAIALFMALNGFGIWSLVAQALVMSNVKLIMLFSISRPKIGFAFNLSEIRGMISYGVDAVLSNVSVFISRSVDNLIIGAFLGATNLGWYAMSYQISWMPDAVLSGPVYASMLPVMGRKSHDRSALKTLFLASFTLVSAIVIPTFFGVALTADLTVPLFLGEKWLPAIGLLQILAVAGCVNCLFTIVSVSLLAAGHSRDQLLLTLYIAGLVVIAVVVGLFFGVSAVAAGVAAASIAAAPMYLERAYTRFGVSLWEVISRVGPPVISGACMAAAITALRRTLFFGIDPRIELALVIMDGAGVYLAIMALFTLPRLLISLHHFREG